MFHSLIAHLKLPESEDVQDLETLREKMISFINAICVIIALPLIISYFHRGLTISFTLSFYLQISVYVIFLYLFIKGKEVHYKKRAAIIATCIIASSLLGYSQWAILGQGPITLIAGAILIATFFSFRTALVVALLISTCVSLITCFFSLGILKFSFDLVQYVKSPDLWTTFIINFSFVILSLVSLLAWIQSSLQHSILNLRKKTEELKIKNERLAIAEEKATQANNAKDEFLRVMSHELRTPLNPIMGCLELMDTEELSQEMKEYIRMMAESGNDLISMIDDILNFTRMDITQTSPNRDETDLSQLVKTAKNGVSKEAIKKGLTLHTTIDDSCSNELFILDQELSLQLLTKLLSNAIKFTSEGCVQLQVKRINKASTPYLRFLIRDSGEGVPEELRQFIFEPFTQADSSNKRSNQGLGLGLAICRKLADIMQGSLDFQSEAGKGSTFWFDLPAINPTPTEKISSSHKEMGDPS